MSWDSERPPGRTEVFPTVSMPRSGSTSPNAPIPPHVPDMYPPTAPYPASQYPPPQYPASQYPPSHYPTAQYPVPLYPTTALYYPPQPPPPPRRRGLLIGIALVMVLLVGVAAVSFVFVLGVLQRPTGGPVAQNPGNTATPAVPTPVPATGGAGSGPIDVDSLAAKVNPGVVDINTTLGFANARAAGTGIVLTSTGLVLTNNHVIAGATEISVVDVGNGRTYGATVLGYDRDDDIGLIQLTNASGLAVLTPADSSQVHAGDPILAVGNAGGTGGTPSAAPGTVTALNRTITASDELDGSTNQLEGLIQVAANIQAGDSGGPLVDRLGHVIGVDTAASSSYQVQAAGGQGYAIPINHALAIAQQIQSNKATDTIHIGPTALLGVQTTSGGRRAAGASVVSVVDGGPAARAGLQQGDLIQSLDGKTVDSPTALGSLINAYHPGDHASLVWTDRVGQSHTATVTFTEGPPA